MLDDIIKFVSELLDGKEISVNYRDNKTNDELKLVQAEGSTSINANILDKNLKFSLKDQPTEKDS